MNVLDMIGNTPLLSLDTDGLKNGVKLFAKAEFMNVGGSVKDRAAKAMLLGGIESGRLTRDKTVIDATSGNTAITLLRELIQPIKIYQANANKVNVNMV